MAYKSQYVPVRFQATSTGRPREAKDSELNQISNALSNFNKSFSNFTSAYKKEQQNEAQDVFDNLKAQGITDPDEIKKLIDNKDPRVANLKGYYAKAVVDANFGLAHAIEDFNSVETKVANITGGDETGESMANLNVDSLFQTEDGNPLRVLDTQTKSYTRAYTDSMNQMRLDLDAKVSKAKGLLMNKQTNDAAFLMIGKAWEQGGADGLKELRFDKVVSEKFVNKNDYDKNVLNYLEQRATLIANGVVGDPSEFKKIVDYLKGKRGQDGKIPSFLETPGTQEQATKIITAITSAVNSGTKKVNVEKMFFEGVGHKEIYNGQKVSESDKKIAQDSIYNKIVTLVDEEAKIWESNPANRGQKFPKEDKVNAYIASIMSKNATVFYPWKEELELGIGLINNTNIFQVDQVPQFIKAYNKFKMLKRLGQDNNPVADYLTGKEEIFYEGVLALEKNGMELNDAVAKMWQVQNVPSAVKVFEQPDDEIQSGIEEKFKFWFKDDADTTAQVQEAIRIAKVFMITGVNETLATQKAIDMVTKSYIAVDGILWNKRKMPGLDGDATFHKELTQKSIYLSEEVAKKSKFYEPEDLVLAPWFGNMFVVMDRNTMAPVSVEGKSFAFTYSEIFNNNSKFNKAFLDNANWNKVLKERNEKLLKLYKGEELPQYNEVDDINAYNEMKDGLKIVKE
jgi:hypothetical protein